MCILVHSCPRAPPSLNLLGMHDIRPCPYFLNPNLILPHEAPLPYELTIDFGSFLKKCLTTCQSTAQEAVSHIFPNIDIASTTSPLAFSDLAAEDLIASI